MSLASQYDAVVAERLAVGFGRVYERYPALLNGGELSISRQTCLNPLR